MIASVARYAPSIVAGSALAGFGLSLGRDVYKQTKKNWPIVVILVCFVGVYFSGMWLFRNYRTFAGSVFKRIGALIMLAASCIGVYIGAGFVAAMFLPLLLPLLPVATTFMNEISDDGTENTVEELPVDDIDNTVEANQGDEDYLNYLTEPPLVWIFVVQGGMFVIGSIVGISHRRRRRLAWEAEYHNEAFLSEIGLEVIDTDEKGNIRLRDHAEGIGYRMMEDLKIAGELEFMALGKRNKRGYMYYDDTGKYTQWSGLVDVR